MLAQPYQTLVFSLLQWLDQPRLSRNETPGATYHLHVLPCWGFLPGVRWCFVGCSCTSPVSAQAEPGRSGSSFLGTSFPRAGWHRSSVYTSGCTVVVELSLGWILSCSVHQRALKHSAKRCKFSLPVRVLLRRSCPLKDPCRFGEPRVSELQPERNPSAKSVSPAGEKLHVVHCPLERGYRGIPVVVSSADSPLSSSPVLEHRGQKSRRFPTDEVELCSAPCTRIC